MKYGNNNYGSFVFLVDGDRVAHVNEYDHDDTVVQGSATINLYLTTGQTVQVQNLVSNTVWGTDTSGFLYSWFTGFLLYAF